MVIVHQKKQKKIIHIKSDINEILKGRKKSEEQNSAIKNIKILNRSQEKVIKLFNDYSKTVSEAKYKTKCGEGLQILTPKQRLQRFPTVLAQVKAGNTSENLVNEIHQTIYSLYQEDIT